MVRIGVVKVVGMARMFFCSFILLSSIATNAQEVEIKGRIVDENGLGLPFATVHQKNTTNGTTSNAQGYYSLKIKTGDHLVVFKFVGYTTVERPLSPSGTLDVQMHPEVWELEALVIQAGEEDPAYPIIRKAIAKRAFHLAEITGYQCQVYIKGLQRLDESPGQILGIPVTVDTGIVYLSESVSELNYKHPDQVKEEVISSKVSGDNRAFSFNQASDFLISFYENQIYSEGLSERAFISPIADQALLYYLYELEGSFKEGSNQVHRIKVIPRRGHDPSFSGYINIIDGSWRIHSVDLMLTKDHQIEFVDSLHIKQVYAPSRQGNQEVWTLLTQQFDFQLNALGFKGNGYFIGVYSEYQLNKDFQAGFFDNEIVSVDAESNKKDSIYWQDTRPVPLTAEETEDYRVKDSLQIIKESESYLDSIDRKNNKVTLTHILTGKTFHDSYRKQSWRVPALTELLQFNTVEGFVINPGVRFTQRYEDHRFYRIEGELRYGFSSEKFYGRIRTRYYYNPLRFSSLRLDGGRYIESINRDIPLTPFDNSYYSLILEKNFLKIYQKSYFRIGHDIELFNGWYLKSGIEWAQRESLSNSTDYTLKDRTEREYTSNNPENLELGNTNFLSHQALVLDLQVKWQPGQNYIKRPYRKFVLPSKLPALTLSYQAGLSGVLGSDITFQKLRGEVAQNFRLGLWGSARYLLAYGGLLQKDSLTFIDYQHFNGNRTVFGHFELGNYQLLDYYLYSTRDHYFQAHYEHHFNGFIINKIPLLRKTKIQTVLSVNYLRTSDSYWELGLGLEHIFKILRIDFYQSWIEDAQQKQGFRFGIGF